MSRRYMTVAALLLITMTLQACHKSPTAPEPPEVASNGTAVSVGTNDAKGGKPGKPGGGGGGGGGGDSAGVELQGGVVGAPQTVPIAKDSSRELNLQGPHTNTINLASTHAARSSVCSVQKGNPTAAEQEALLTKLLDGSQDRFRLVIVVDRSGSDHRLTLNFDDFDGPFEGVIVNVTDGVSVSEGPADTFTFSGGDVLVQDKRGKVKDRVTLRCQNLDTITAILDR